MLSLETIWTFFFASLLMAMTPGPDVIIVLTQSSLYGMRAGLLTTFGLMTGLLGHTLAVALGVAVLFQTSEAAFTALKLLGAAYLLYLAYQSFRSGVFRAFLTQSRDAVPARLPFQHHQSQGYAVLPCRAAPVRQAGTRAPHLPDTPARRAVRTGLPPRVRSHRRARRQDGGVVQPLGTRPVDHESHRRVRLPHLGARAGLRVPLGSALRGRGAGRRVRSPQRCADVAQASSAERPMRRGAFQGRSAPGAFTGTSPSA